MRGSILPSQTIYCPMLATVIDAQDRPKSYLDGCGGQSELYFIVFDCNWHCCRLGARLCVPPAATRQLQPAGTNILHFTGTCTCADQGHDSARRLCRLQTCKNNLCTCRSNQIFDPVHAVAHSLHPTSRPGHPGCSQHPGTSPVELNQAVVAYLSILLPPPTC